MTADQRAAEFYKKSYDSIGAKITLCPICKLIKEQDYTHMKYSSTGSSGPSIASNMVCLCWRKNNGQVSA